MRGKLEKRMIHPEARFPSIERRYDPPDKVDVYGVATTVTVRIPTLPDTGFAPNRITRLPSQPPAKQYQLLSEAATRKAIPTPF